MDTPGRPSQEREHGCGEDERFEPHSPVAGMTVLQELLGSARVSWGEWSLQGAPQLLQDGTSRRHARRRPPFPSSARTTPHLPTSHPHHRNSPSSQARKANCLFTPCLYISSRKSPPLSARSFWARSRLETESSGP